MDELRGGLGEAVRQSADPLSKAFEKIAAVYSERAVREISVIYTSRGFTLRAPVGLRREVILIILNSFAGLGWGFATERTSDETVQSVTFSLPMEQTQIGRHLTTERQAALALYGRHAPKPGIHRTKPV